MSDSPLADFTPTDLGERLRIAREVAKLTQKQAADAINVARTTLVAIEQGQRRIRIDEIQRLAMRYKTSVNALLRREAIHVDLVPRFRKLNSGNDEGSDLATELLSNLARAEVELENLLGITRPRNYPPERSILGGDVVAQAEQDALELRHWLGLGYAPVLDIVTLLELNLGIRVYIRRLDSKISGVFAYDEALGACILLNANHPKERRSQTSAHELGHFVSARGAPEVLHINEPTDSREERYANAFGRSFLTPARAVRQKFQEITAGASHLTRRHIIILAHFFGVAREAMARRFEELELAKKGTWDWFEANGGITDVQAQQVLGDLITPDKYTAEADRPTTLRLNLLAAEVYRQELLSEGQLARLLHLDRVELREIVHDSEGQEEEPDGAPNALA
jgi:Zn-dependent peptidase ImmA (M78 family)/transcriptional regulator with XRE-family HTH domain